MAAGRPLKVRAAKGRKSRSADDRDPDRNLAEIGATQTTLKTGTDRPTGPAGRRRKDNLKGIVPNH